MCVRTKGPKAAHQQRIFQGSSTESIGRVRRLNHLPVASTVIVLLLMVTTLPIGEAQTKPTSNLVDKLTMLESFLLNQFDPKVGLLRESPDDSINRTYWLLSDNLLAYHALRPYHPDIAMRIEQTLHKFGLMKDDLHEALFGEVIDLPPHVPQIVTLDRSDTWEIKIEIRTNQTSKLMDDWTDYGDLLIYAALSENNRGNLALGLEYFDRAVKMWNGAGLFDLPTRLDGFYTTHKLALLLYASKVLNQTLPFRDALEDRIWQFQRDDGGIRSHYLGNLTSTREANTETASLVLLAYNYGFERTSELLESYDTGERFFWSPEARSLMNQSRKAYKLATGSYHQRDFESASAHVQAAIALLNQAETIESGFRELCTLFAILIIVGVSTVVILSYKRRRGSGSSASSR